MCYIGDRQGSTRVIYEEEKKERKEDEMDAHVFDSSPSLHRFKKFCSYEEGECLMPVPFSGPNGSLR